MQFGLSDDQIAAKAALMPVLRKELSLTATGGVVLLRRMSVMSGFGRHCHGAWKQSVLSPVLMLGAHKGWMFHSSMGISRPSEFLVVVH